MKENKFIRNCPVCKKPIQYAIKYSMDQADKNRRLCKSCSKKGDKNSFFNKKHTEESKLKIKQSFAKSIKREEFVKKQSTEEFRKQISKKMSGKNNPAYNRGTLKDLWVKKHGDEIADIKDKNWKKRLSEKCTGENNNMYGKPSPNGSGNGWSGWYNGWFFRSLGELSFMIKVIERFGFNWETGETNKYKIMYSDINGKIRNYFPDFILNQKYMIECKPKKLQNSINVQCKKKSAIEFCQKNNLIYKLIHPHKLTNEEIVNLYNIGKIKFIEKYEQKFKILNNINNA